MKKYCVFGTLLVIFILLLLACNRPHKVRYSDTFTSEITIDGSSTEYPLSEAIVKEYLEDRPLVNIKLAESNTGTGFIRFIRGETDINNASRKITQSEADACKVNGVEFLELEVAYDAIAIVVNPQNTWAKDITVAELQKLWKSSEINKITKWNQLRTGWPDKEIHLYGPDSMSGTYNYFTDVILDIPHKKSRKDYTASRNHDEIASNIKLDELGLGYLGVVYYENNKQGLKLLAVDDLIDSNGRGPFLPTIDNVRDRLYSPLARPLYIYVNSKSLNKNAIKSFVSFYITNCSRIAYETGYIPLDASDYKKSKKIWKAFLRKFSKEDLKGFPGSS